MNELEQLEIELFVAHKRADFWANQYVQYVLPDAKAWAEAEVLRIEAEIVKLKEQDNEF